MDCEMMFEQETKYKRLGIIFRAANLENYFMLQIECDGEKIKINPHIRWQGKWDIYHDNLISDDIAMKYDQYHKIKLTVNKLKVNLFINGMLSYEWMLPSHVEAKYKQYDTQSDKEYNAGGQLNVVPIMFRLKHGMVGFRADREEKALIRNLEIKGV